MPPYFYLDWAKLISNVLATIIWPLLALFVFVYLRVPLYKLLDNVRIKEVNIAGVRLVIDNLDPIGERPGRPLGEVVDGGFIDGRIESTSV